MANSPKLRKASTLFIFITLAIDAIGLGIVIPVLPDVVRKFISDEGSVSRIFGLFIATYALLQFVSSPLLGRLSDRRSVDCLLGTERKCRVSRRPFDGKIMNPFRSLAVVGILSAFAQGVLTGPLVRR